MKASEIAQWVRTPANKCEDPGLIPDTHTEEGKNRLLKVIFSSSHVHQGTSSINKCKKKIPCKKAMVSKKRKVFTN